MREQTRETREKNRLPHASAVPLELKTERSYKYLILALLRRGLLPLTCLQGGKYSHSYESGKIHSLIMSHFICARSWSK